MLGEIFDLFDRGLRQMTFGSQTEHKTYQDEFNVFEEIFLPGIEQQQRRCLDLTWQLLQSSQMSFYPKTPNAAAKDCTVDSDKITSVCKYSEGSRKQVFMHSFKDGYHD